MIKHMHIHNAHIWHHWFWAAKAATTQGLECAYGDGWYTPRPVVRDCERSFRFSASRCSWMVWPPGFGWSWLGRTPAFPPHTCCQLVCKQRHQAKHFGGFQWLDPNSFQYPYLMFGGLEIYFSMFTIYHNLCWAKVCRNLVWMLCSTISLWAHQRLTATEWCPLVFHPRMQFCLRVFAVTFHLANFHLWLWTIMRG